MLLNFYKMYNYLLYKFYSAHKKNMDTTSALLLSMAFLDFILTLNFGTILFFIEGVFGIHVPAGKWIIVVVLVPICLYYLPGKRYERIFKRCRAWEERHPVLKRIHGGIYYLIGVFFSGFLCLLSGMYANGDILSTWRF